MGGPELIGLFGTGSVLLLLLVTLFIVLYLVPIPLWIAAWASGAYVGLTTLVAMRLRRVPPNIVINARIRSFANSSCDRPSIPPPAPRPGWSS